MKTYQVLTVVNDWYRNKVAGWNSYQLSSLPVFVNAPMRAKETLLAQMLRTGRYVCEKQRMAQNQPVHPKSMPTLVGKMLGVEIEYYPGAKEPRETQLSKSVDDGSLNHGGRELRKLTWASKTGRLEGLLALNLNGRVDKACGLHVHVDARHLGKDGLLTAEETYDRLCNFFFALKKLVPKSRRNNRFCKFYNNRPGSECFQEPQSGERYAAINWCSFARHGTLEFRCQGGSVNTTKIETWALLCQFLLGFAASPANTIPRNWDGFIIILPEPLRSWCILRNQKLNGDLPEINERTMSGTL